MTKPLSEMLEAMEPHPIAKDATLVPRASYDKLKAVAILLAKACEVYADSGKLNNAGEALSRAKEIIGGGEYDNN